MSNIRKVSVVGLGYIGLPTAAVLASAGVEVVGFDIKQEVVEKINRGEVHIVEDNLASLVHDAVSSRKLRASSELEPADVFIIAVPTPFKDGYLPDISHVKSAVDAIAVILKKGNLVILESTSPIGTTEQISQWMAEIRHDLRFPHQTGEKADIHIAYCPERVLPGQILKELIENCRVIGGITPMCAQRAWALYKLFVKGDCVITNARTAEMVKLAENSFRDLNIAFANELSLICEKVNIDVWELIRLANRHPRVNISQPGPGVGGHCIAIDPWFIVYSAPNDAKLIRMAREVNISKTKHVLDKIKTEAAKFKKPIIACLGLAYKADTDDLRESPAKIIVEDLASGGYGDILVVEPYISALPDNLVKLNVKLMDLFTALKTADIVVLLVNHKIFYSIEKQSITSKNVIDTRGVF